MWPIERRFDPFGKVVSSANSNGFGGQSYGFTGLEHDESGLVYARNRYYSPGLGRFISEDPIGFGGGSNFFAYCGNDPINFTDPLGLMAMGLYDGGGVWFGGTADSPALAFGGPTSTPAAPYRCSRAEVDESSPAFDGGFVSMRSQHEGMDGKSARSRWAYHAIEKVRDQYCGAAFSFATAGLGMMAVETAEGMAAARGVAAAEEAGVAAGSSSKVLLRSSLQLQKKFKHAVDFGVQGNWNNKDAAAKFSAAIHQHINQSGLLIRNGTYMGNPVTHYLNPMSGLNVMVDPSGSFVSGWKLNPVQLANVLFRGSL